MSRPSPADVARLPVVRRPSNVERAVIDGDEQTRPTYWSKPCACGCGTQIPRHLSTCGRST